MKGILKVRFCWECGNKLRGNHFKKKIIDGNERILHKQCAKLYKSTTYCLSCSGDGFFTKSLMCSGCNGTGIWHVKENENEHGH